MQPSNSDLEVAITALSFDDDEVTLYGTYEDTLISQTQDKNGRNLGPSSSPATSNSTSGANGNMTQGNSTKNQTGNSNGSFGGQNNSNGQGQNGNGSFGG